MLRHTDGCDSYLDFILLSDGCHGAYDARITNCFYEYPQGISNLRSYLNVKFVIYNILETGSHESSKFR